MNHITALTSSSFGFIIYRCFQNETKVDEKGIQLSQLELGGNKMGVREINYLGDFVTSYPPLVSIVSIFIS